MIAPTRFYADFMRERLAFEQDAIEVMHNGIRLDGYPSLDAVSSGRPPCLPSENDNMRQAAPRQALGPVLVEFLRQGGAQG